VCGSPARTDLYGGQLAIAVPTVTGSTPPKKSDRTGSNLCRHDSSYKHHGSRSTGSKASSLCLASKQLRRAPSLLRGEPPLHRPSESQHKLCAARRPPRVGTPTNRAGNQVTSMIGKIIFSRSGHSLKTVLLWNQESTRQRHLHDGPAWPCTGALHPCNCRQPTAIHQRLSA
jgi:hypothetical protein